MMKWLSSYSNHILHCSLYTTIVAYAIKSSKTFSTKTRSTNNNNSWSNLVVPLLFGGFAAFGLWGELDYMSKRKNLPPGDSGYPFLGHFIQWMTNPRKVMKEREAKYGIPFTFNFCMVPTVFVSSDADVRWFIAQERKGLIQPNFLEPFKQLLGAESITFQASRDHRRLRRIFEPSFSPSSIQSYVETIDDIAKEELEKWCANEEFCTSKNWANLAMREFMACALGSIDETLLDKLSKLMVTWFNGFTAAIPLPIPGTTLGKGQAAGKEVLKLLQRMVDEFKANNPPGSPAAENSMMGRLCYGVDDDGNTLTDEQLTTNIRFIMFAGHDTTKGSFSAFIHYLAEDPKITLLLREEVSGFSEPLNVDELKSAPLLNAVLAETWRLVPPVDTHEGGATRVLEYKGYKIPVGADIAADMAYDCVTNEEKYANPQEFHVERWIPKGHPLHDPKYCVMDAVDYNSMSATYRPFAFGMHVCLGAHFAKLESRVVLTRLLQNYDFTVRNSYLITSPLLQFTNEFKLTKL